MQIFEQKNAKKVHFVIIIQKIACYIQENLHIFKLNGNFAAYSKICKIMNTKQFLKVTPKGGGRSVVVPAQNREFYLSQGAKVEEPTEEEIRKEFPEYAARVDREQRANPDKRNVKDSLNHQVQKLNDKVASLEKDLKKRDDRIAALESENAQLRMVIGGGDDAPENPAPEPEPEAPADEKPKSEPAKKTSRGGRRK